MDSSSHLVRVIGLSSEGRWINLCSHPTVICRYCISNLLLKPHFVTCVKPQPFSWIGVGVQNCWSPVPVLVARGGVLALAECGTQTRVSSGRRHGNTRYSRYYRYYYRYLSRYLDTGQLVEQTRTALHISGDLWQSASVAVRGLLRHVSDVSQCSAWRVQDSQNEPSFIVSEIHVAH